MDMIRFESPTIAYFVYTAATLTGLLLLYLGFRFGRWIGTINAHKLIEDKEQELFTAQKGFKVLYEEEIAKLKQSNADLKDRVAELETRTEEYRKKAAGFGGLFSSSSTNKRAEAMYALLLENEALEEALIQKNDKLRQERQDALHDQIRSTGYRRVLISQLLNDERIKPFVTEQLSDDRRLPDPHSGANGNPAALPDPNIK